MHTRGFHTNQQITPKRKRQFDRMPDTIHKEYRHNAFHKLGCNLKSYAYCQGKSARRLSYSEQSLFNRLYYMVSCIPVVPIKAAMWVCALQGAGGINSVTDIRRMTKGAHQVLASRKNIPCKRIGWQIIHRNRVSAAFTKLLVTLPWCRLFTIDGTIFAVLVGWIYQLFIRKSTRNLRTAQTIGARESGIILVRVNTKGNKLIDARENNKASFLFVWMNMLLRHRTFRFSPNIDSRQDTVRKCLKGKT